MVEEAQGRPGMPAVSQVQPGQTFKTSEIQYKYLSKPFTTTPVTDCLLPGCSSRNELDTALRDYMNSLSGLTFGNDLQKYKGLLEPSLFLPGEIRSGNEVSLMSGLHSLELLKNVILTVESCILTTIANN